MTGRWWLGIALAIHLLTATIPVARDLARSPASGDFASFYYAAHAALDGADPYDTAGLSTIARADGARRTVQPYYYPPAFLITQLWAPFFPLKLAQWGMFLLNELALGASLLLLRRFGVGVPAIALMLATFTPITENLRLLQANLLTLVPLLAALAYPRFVGLLGAAATFKMSPALLLLELARTRRWKDILLTGAFALGLALVSFILVEPAFQRRFYLEVLPAFFRGDYGIDVPVHFPGNHSIPDLFAKIFPGPRPTTLSGAARVGSVIVSVGMLGLWAWRARHIGDARSIGALLVVMTVVPTYTWEPHLVFLLLPLGLALTGAQVGFPAQGLLVYALVAHPMSWTLTLGDHRLLAEVVHTFKTTGELLLFVVMLYPRSRAISAIASQTQGAP